MSKATQKTGLLMELNPYSPIAEMYHSLRANIDFSASKQTIRALTVTSSQRGEGKSTTVTNLALAYARAGKKVLLVDADLRMPALHAILGVTRRAGLSNYLAGQCEPAEAIKETAYPNLCVVTSGTLSANPSELLSSPRLRELFEDVKQAYDIVLVDAPPLLAVADTQIVAAVTDGVVLVIEYGKTKRAFVLKAVKSLEHVRDPLLGTVINKANRKEMSSY